MLQWTWGCTYTSELVFLFSLGKYPEVELLNHMVVVCVCVCERERNLILDDLCPLCLAQSLLLCKKRSWSGIRLPEPDFSCPKKVSPHTELFSLLCFHALPLTFRLVSLYLSFSHTHTHTVLSHEQVFFPHSSAHNTYRLTHTYTSLIVWLDTVCCTPAFATTKSKFIN